MKQPILSICIPTYNRCGCLKELIESVLSIERDDIEVVVTDNLSTDMTIDMLNNISDPRLRVCRNEEPLNAYHNMICSIFNANGNYALYCNDRDILIPDKIVKVIDILYQDNYSFISLSPVGSCTDQLSVYQCGVESLRMQGDSHHPTGMVFNRELMKKHFRKEDYYQYFVFSYDFLMRDLLWLEKSASYDCGAWTTRPLDFLRHNRAGTQSSKDLLWFYPEFWPLYIQDVLKQLSETGKWSSEQERDDLFLLILFRNFKNTTHYKYFMVDPYQTAHYGIEMKFITTPEMIRHYIGCYNSLLTFFQENNYSAKIIEQWKAYWVKGLAAATVDSLVVTAKIVVKKLLRLNR